MDQLKEAELEAQVVQIGLNEQAKQLT
jgi:hypothetical protein